MDALTIAVEQAQTPDVQDLLNHHFKMMRDLTPAEGCHVIKPAQFEASGAVLMGARKNGILLGIGALKSLDATHGELKSMHTVGAARGQGVARALLKALLAYSETQGMSRVSLETGTDPAFAAARALYTSHGFTECDPFADYVPYPLSVYMTKAS